MNTFSWWKLSQNISTTRRNNAPTAISAEVETMETRQLLSASALFLPETGELSIDLGDSDSIQIGSVNGNLSVLGSTNGGGYLPITTIGTVSAANVLSIDVLGGDDANTIDLSGVTSAAFTSLTSIVADGANGHDTLIGSPDLADSLIGGNGDDTIQGQGGNDTLIGGDGNDSISGDTGDDSINAGDGDDVVVGDDGNDAITAGNGQDTVSGGNGDDSIGGANGQDLLNGDAGNDTLNGDGGTDTVDGGTGDDLVFGGELNDNLLGSDGNDTINGQGGNDNIDGGLGNDSLLGNAGDDTLLGNDGDDIANGGLGNDSVEGGIGNDAIYGGAGNDLLNGDSGDDSAFGQGGDDTLLGADGNDVLDGGAGDDIELADVVAVGVINTYRLAAEGTGGSTVIQFVVGLSQTSFGTTSVNFSTVDGTALAGQDYVATSGTVSFAPGQLTQIVSVTVIADSLDEVDETFSLVLSNPVNVAIADGTSVVTIVDDDLASVSVNDVSAVEGGAATSGSAVLPGFNANTLARNDDNSTGLVPIGFPINFFGQQFANLYVNNNGNVSFTGPLFTFTPFPLLTTNTAIIAPFFADVDTSGATSMPVTYGPGIANGRTAFGVNWVNVGHFPSGTPLNSFQLILIERSDIGPGDFDIEFNYGSILWESGGASGGNAQGLGGRSARVGFSNGTTTSFELPGSAINGAFLDSGPAATSLIQNSLNSPTLGTYLFRARNGGVSVASSNSAVFTVTLDSPSVTPVSVDYSTSDLTANSTDYTATSGTLTFAPGVTSLTVTVPILDDAVVEPDDTFALTLSNPIGAVLGDAQGIGTILNDDGVTTLPTPSSTPPTVPTFPNITRFVTTPGPLFSNAAAAFSNTLRGGDGNDTLLGGFGDDVFNGQAGDDLILAGGGNDVLTGGAGNDTLDGQAGNDTLDGQGGNDLLIGSDGNDSFVLGNGAGGDDTAIGGEGFNQIVVNGTGNAETLIVGQSSGRIVVTRGLATITADNNMSVQAVTVNALAGDDTVIVQDLSAIASQTLVTINGGDGNDRISGAGANLGSTRLFLNGENGNDTIIGTNGHDAISGGTGDDQVNGQAGNDSITGAQGDDVLSGGLGNDSIDGGNGNDFLTGQAGDDFIVGGDGNDTLRGFEGNDTLLGVTGEDLLNGMDGNDSISGGVGMDQITGGSGDDTLDGGRNNDTINGNSGNDLIHGDHGHDYINAGTESDTVIGGDGNDTIIATDGSDVLAGNDGDDQINAGAGNDILVGGDGNDTLLGGGGSDVLLGGDGDDYINGQGGTDTIAGNQGIDVIADPLSEIDERYILSAAIVSLLSM